MSAEHTRIVQIAGAGGGGGPYTVTSNAAGDISILDTASGQTALIPIADNPNIYQVDAALSGNRVVSMGANNLVFDNALGGDFRITGKLTVDGLIDPTGLQFSGPQGDAGMPNETIFITDGSVSGIPAGELIFKDAAGNYHQLENTLGAANNRAFADDTTMAPALPGSPTEAEAQAFAAGAGLVDTLVYYTGNDTATDPIAYVWHIDAAGAATELANPSSATTFGQYQGQWDPSLGAAPGATASRDWFLIAGTAATVPALGGTTTYNPGDLVIALSTPVLGDAQLQIVPITTAAATANNRVHADDTTVAPATAGAPTEAEIQAFATGAGVTDGLVYYTGDDLPASAATYVAFVDGAGVATLIEVPAAAGSILTVDQTQTAARTHDHAGQDITFNDFRLMNFISDLANVGGTFNGFTARSIDSGASATDERELVISTAATQMSQRAGDIVAQFTTDLSGRISMRRLDVATTNDALFSLEATGAILDLGPTQDFRVNTDAGVTGQVLTSQGPNVPPIWTTPAGGTFGQFGGLWDPSLGAAPAATNGNDWFYVTGTASTVPALGGGVTYNPGDLVVALAAPVLGDAQLQVLPFGGGGADTNMMTGPLTSTGLNVTHDFNGSLPTWDDMGGWQVNGQASAIFQLGIFGLQNYFWQVDNNQVRLEAGAFGALSTMVVNDNNAIVSHNAGAAGVSSLTANADGLALTFPTAGDLQLGGDPGAVGEVLTSQGPNLPPVWNPGGGANNRVHADDTTVAPATAATPTLAEIQAFVTGAGVSDTTVYYTGDDVAASAPTHVYVVDAAGTATFVEGPTSGTPADLVHVVFSGGGQDDIPTNHKFPLTNVETLSGPLTVAAGATDIVLPQSPVPYHLEAFFEFDLDATATGTTSIMWREPAATAGPPIGDYAVRAHTQDSGNVLQSISTRAYALIDASAGPVTVTVQNHSTASANHDANSWSGSIRQYPTAQVVDQTTIVWPNLAVIDQNAAYTIGDANFVVEEYHRLLAGAAPTLGPVGANAIGNVLHMSNLAGGAVTLLVGAGVTVNLPFTINNNDTITVVVVGVNEYDVLGGV